MLEGCEATFSKKWAVSLCGFSIPVHKKVYHLGLAKVCSV